MSPIEAPLFGIEKDDGNVHLGTIPVIYGVRGRIRTVGVPLRRRTLYPTEVHELVIIFYSILASESTIFWSTKWKLFAPLKINFGIKNNAKIMPKYMQSQYIVLRYAQNHYILWFLVDMCNP